MHFSVIYVPTLLLLTSIIPPIAEAFISSSSLHHSKGPSNVVPSASSNSVEISFPTPADAASMGIRDWPQTYHSSDWTESIEEGEKATRYILGGNGRIRIQYYDDGGRNAERRERVYPGTLVQVDGEARLLWEISDGQEGMIVLTPGFEEGGKLVLVVGFFVVLCAGLLAGPVGL